MGGPCEIFEPPCSFWCKGTAGFTPSGLVLDAANNRSWSDPVGGGAEIFAWRQGHWNNWMFEMAGIEYNGGGTNSTTLHFGRGGFQVRLHIEIRVR